MLEYILLRYYKSFHLVSFIVSLALALALALALSRSLSLSLSLSSCLLIYLSFLTVSHNTPAGVH